MMMNGWYLIGDIDQAGTGRLLMPSMKLSILCLKLEFNDDVVLF